MPLVERRRNDKCPKSPHGKHSFMAKRNGVNVMVKDCAWGCGESK